MELLTVKQASKMLNISPNTLYYFTKYKKIPYIKISGIIRFVKEDIEEFIMKNKISAQKTEK